MLQRRSRNREFESFALCFLGQQTMDQTPGEGITAADTIDNRVDFITLGLIEFLAVIDQS